MSEQEASWLDEVKEAMLDDQVRIEVVRVFMGSARAALQVEHRPYGGRWTKAGPLLFPPSDGDIAATFSMLMEMRTRVEALPSV